MRFSKKAVIGILAFLGVFTAIILWLHFTTGSIPDTLVDKVFDFCKVEAGALGLIKISENLPTKKNNKEEPNG